MYIINVGVNKSINNKDATTFRAIPAGAVTISAVSTAAVTNIAAMSMESAINKVSRMFIKFISPEMMVL
jgi:hypothetical protein